MKKIFIIVISLFMITLFGELIVSADTDLEIKKDMELAELGNAGALFRLGARYLNGSGVAVDNATAFEYLSKAGEKGHANALYNIGYMYLYGIGRGVNFKIASGYFERSKSLGFMPAYHVIAVMIEDGAFYKHDINEAKKHYKISADNGYEPSIRRLKELADQQ